MKKVMKSFTTMALALSLVLTGCSKSDDKEISFEGNYTASAIVDGPSEALPTGKLTIPTSLNLVKVGADYQASANLADYGALSLSLTSVTEKNNIGGNANYTFNVESQMLDIMGGLPVSGNGILESKSVDGQISYKISIDLIVAQMGISVSITGEK